MTALSLALWFMFVAAAVSIVTEQLRIPYTIALVIAGLVIGNMHLAPPITVTPEVLLTLLIPPLLFEGGLRLPPKPLRTYAGLIGGLAIPGTIVTALAVGWIVHALFHLELRSALLLGAIISAIDPVSVLAFLRETRLDHRLGAVLEGEAVLNDGVAIILFTIVASGAAADLLGASVQFIWLLGGGLGIGVLVALTTSYALGRTQQPLVEALGSLIAALSALLAANSIGASGMIAVVTAGVVFAGYGPRHLTESGLETVRTLWDVIAFLANSLLFLLIGLEVPAMLLVRHWLLIVAVVGVAFAVRAAIVYGLTSLGPRPRRVPPAWRFALLWGGLRGGVAIALALDLDRAIPGREAVVATAFGIVVFTLLAQGLSVRRIMRWAGLLSAAHGEATSAVPP
jgi:CPA1 family monovalent cation:H+ antiporter